MLLMYTLKYNFGTCFLFRRSAVFNHVIPDMVPKEKSIHFHFLNNNNNKKTAVPGKTLLKSSHCMKGKTRLKI